MLSNRLAITLVSTLGLLAGCTASPANPDIVEVGRYREHPQGDETIVRGVVNGLYEYNPDRTATALEKYAPGLSADDRAELSRRYVVRIGVNRGYSPVLVNLAVAADYVLLPAGWKHDRSAISADPSVVNVGDIVEFRMQAHRYFNYLDSVVRKCDATPVANEKRDWQIGCKTYPAWDAHGYAGEIYHFTKF